jgi:hypothetical protein
MDIIILKQRNRVNSSNPNISNEFESKSRSECKGYARIYYVGGHKAWPKPVMTMIFVYDDRIELSPKQQETVISIPYSEIVNIENMDEQRISTERVVGLGLVFVPLAIVGAIWKKRHIYTVIRYRDINDEQTIILDFEDNIDKFQPYIYNKMLENRK